MTRGPAAEAILRVMAKKTTTIAKTPRGKAVEAATGKVHAKTSIDFVRSIRGR